MVLPQYDSIRPFFLGADPNLAANSDDQERIQAYRAYEDIYWNRPETFKLVQRGDDDQPLYLPSARKIIEATNRFLAVGWDFNVASTSGTAEEQKSTRDFLSKLFKREKVYTKFKAQKRNCLIRGDAVWHIIADKNKVAGRRMTIQEVQPHNYFPITSKDDPDVITGVHLVNLVPDPSDPKKQVARRQTYRRVLQANGTYIVTSELGLYEIGKWDDRFLEPGDISRIALLRPEFVLEGIGAIPVYHIPNFHSGSTYGFGYSQIRGIEGALGNINQTISDEALTLIMQGLGVYATNAGPAVDDQGNETDYEIGPARVLEYPSDGKFERISGVTTVAPMIDHAKYVMDESMTGVGVPEIAAGRVDVQVAESGISLQFQMSPILAGNAEKEEDMLGTYDQMIYDICQYWLPTFEQFRDAMECEVAFEVGDPMPVNREAVINEVMQLVTPPSPGVPALITLEMAIAKLTELGWEYPTNAVEVLRGDAEKAAALSAADEQANRFAEEQDGAEGDSGTTDSGTSA
jgi:hypothetical protein